MNPFLDGMDAPQRAWEKRVAAASAPERVALRGGVPIRYRTYKHDELLASDYGIAETLRRSPRGAVLVDVGANYGNVAIAAAKLAGADGLVIALEPNPLIFRYLRWNLRLNNLTNVVALNTGLGETHGTMQLRACLFSPIQPCASRSKLIAELLVISKIVIHLYCHMCGCF